MAGSSDTHYLLIRAAMDVAENGFLREGILPIVACFVVIGTPRLQIVLFEKCGRAHAVASGGFSFDGCFLFSTGALMVTMLGPVMHRTLRRLA
jgi:hypothetical protein